MGFVGAIGVLTALLLWHTLGRLTTVLTLVVVAFFLALTLNPLVEFLTRHGLRRGGRGRARLRRRGGASSRCSGSSWCPRSSPRAPTWPRRRPTTSTRSSSSSFVKDLDQHYDVVDKIQAEFNKRITDGNFISQVFGGVLGVGAAVIGGIFQAFTVLVLTLFLLASLPARQAGRPTRSSPPRVAPA